MDSTGRFLLGGAVGAALGYYLSQRARRRPVLQDAQGEAGQMAPGALPTIEEERQPLSPLMAAAVAQAPVMEPPVDEVLMDVWPATSEPSVDDSVVAGPSVDDSAAETPYAPTETLVPEAPPEVWPVSIAEEEYAPSAVAEAEGEAGAQAETAGELPVDEIPLNEEPLGAGGATLEAESSEVLEVETPAASALVEPALVEPAVTEPIPAEPVAEELVAEEPVFEWERRPSSAPGGTLAVVGEAPQEAAEYEEALSSELVMEPPVAEGHVVEAPVEEGVQGKVETETGLGEESEASDGLEALYASEETPPAEDGWTWEPSPTFAAETPVAVADEHPVVELPVSDTPAEVEGEAATAEEEIVETEPGVLTEQWPGADWSPASGALVEMQAPAEATQEVSEPESPVVELPTEAAEHQSVEMPLEAQAEQPIVEMAAQELPVLEHEARAASETSPAAAVDDLKARIEETRRRIRQELEQPFVSRTPTPPEEADWTVSPALPQEDVAEPEVAEPEVAEPEVAEPEVAEPEAFESEPVPTAEGETPEFDTEDVEPEAEEVVDYDSMRSRIEITRSRLKAKAFDAMMTGEAALLGRDTEDVARRRKVVPAVDSEVDETIESSLREEED